MSLLVRARLTATTETADLPLYQLRHKLGKSGVEVWQALLRRRGLDGATRATAATIAKATGLGLANVRRLYRRLLKAGLLHALGRMHTSMYHHRVLGQLVGGAARVPAHVVPMLEKLATWGGKRMPKKGPRTAHLNDVGAASTIDTLEGGSRASVSTPRGGQVYHPSGSDQDLGSGSAPFCLLPSVEDRTTPRARTRAPLRGAFASGGRTGRQALATPTPAPEGLSRAPAAPPRRDRPVQAPNPQGQDQTRPWPRELGSLLGGRLRIAANPPRRVSLATLAARGLFPAYPTEASLPQPKLPDPPLLGADTPTEVIAGQLVQLYRAVVWAKMGQKPWGLERFKPGADLKLRRRTGEKLDADDAAHERTLRMLHAGGDRLAELEIPPAAWVAWCVDRWISTTKSKRRPKPPPLSWVFGAEQVNDHRGWFARTSSRYMGGRSLLGPQHRDLLVRYHRLRMAASAANTEDPVQLRALVSQHFPEGWKRALEAARSESAATQARVNDQVAKGVYLWR